MGDKVTIRLSPGDAQLIWLILDGCADAGACEGGLEPEERRAIHSVIDQILKQRRASPLPSVEVMAGNPSNRRDEMSDEWLELAWINHSKGIVHGQIDQTEIEHVLTDEQREKVWNLNERHEREQFELLKGFVSWTPTQRGRRRILRTLSGSRLGFARDCKFKRHRSPPPQTRFIMSEWMDK